METDRVDSTNTTSKQIQLRYFVAKPAVSSVSAILPSMPTITEPVSVQTSARPAEGRDGQSGVKGAHIPKPQLSSSMRHPLRVFFMEALVPSFLPQDRPSPSATAGRQTGWGGETATSVPPVAAQVELRASYPYLHAIF